MIPFNVCVIALGYLAGMYLVRPWRSRRTKAAVRIGSDNAYGIYLAQMIFITSLGALGWKTFVDRAPFWLWLPLTVATAYFGGILLTALLARTPLAVPLTGRKQEPWRTLLPRRGCPRLGLPEPVPVAAGARRACRLRPGPLVPYLLRGLPRWRAPRPIRTEHDCADRADRRGGGQPGRRPLPRGCGRRPPR